MAMSRGISFRYKSPFHTKPLSLRPLPFSAYSAFPTHRIHLSNPTIHIKMHILSLLTTLLLPSITTLTYAEVNGRCTAHTSAGSFPGVCYDQTKCTNGGSSYTI